VLPVRCPILARRSHLDKRTSRHHAGAETIGAMTEVAGETSIVHRSSADSVGSGKNPNPMQYFTKIIGITATPLAMAMASVLP
jgi:hypothetical protein